MKIHLTVSGILPLIAASLLITGCGTSFDPADSTPLNSPVGTIQGKVYGGNQPVAGASVYLFATGTTAYGGNGIAASSGNASHSLLSSSGSNTNFDGTNYYVLTASNGSFSISGDYTCTAGTQVYLYVIGGNPGAGVNSASGFLAGLGTCPVAGNLAATVPFVWVSEVSTVVTAYALAGFATDATHISTSGSTLAATGIANAMGNVANLMTVATGAALATTPSGNGTIPQTLINTLANVLAACVSSNGPASSACTTLLGDARSGGGQTGTQATDTATAAIYLAQHPYSAYVATIFGLQTSSGSPFVPALASNAFPANFTISLSFTGGGYTLADGFPRELAVDASGNIWAVSGTSTVLSKFSPLGAAVSSTGYAASPAMVQPDSVAVDNGGATASVYVASFANTGASEVSKFTASTGAFVSNYSVGTAAGPDDIAIDGNGYIWTSDYNVNNISMHAGTGTGAATTYTPTSGTMGAPQSLAITAGTTGKIYVSDYNDGNAWLFTNAGSGSLTNSTAGGNGGTANAVDANASAWFANYGSVNKLTSGGTLTTNNIGTFDNGIAIDGGNTVWVTNENSDNATGEIYQFNNSDVLINGSSGYALSPQGVPSSIVVDGSGNIWYTVINNNTIRELLGVAIPVATPLAYGTANSMLGARP